MDCHYGVTYYIKTGMKGLIVIVFFLVSSAVSAQTLSIEGDVARPGQMSIKGFETLPAVEIKAKGKDGKEHTFKGTYLGAVIQSAGTETGKNNVSKYVLVTGADGYKVVFSFPEVDPDFTEQSIIVATSVDGKPLPAEDGPFRIVVPNDRKQGRWVRQVTSITVISTK
jgi:DMSO/TMAO reductase YedYZ molybdopterin-dependent catalytic subunit